MQCSISTKEKFKCLLFFVLCISCSKQTEKQGKAFTSRVQSSVAAVSKPNIILILADDIGYEIPTFTGGQSYSTPNIDALSQEGMQFTHCLTAPLCSPSRVMLITGKYNFRNYIEWGILDTTQYCIGNLLKDAGYTTCVSGKWQLDGGDASAKKIGFDKYLLFLPFAKPTVEEEEQENKYRYKNPHLYQNGAFLPDSVTNGQYADDMFVDYIKSFIDTSIRSNKPFFVYYPMSLCHLPFYPTPDDPEYASFVPGGKSQNKYFTSMVNYMDKKVGELVSYVNEKGIASNTLILYLGDNGTPKGVYSLFDGKVVNGGKGTTIEYGIHVPFVANWPGKIAPATINENLVNLPDFMPMLASVAGTRIPVDGQKYDGFNFYKSFYDPTLVLRPASFCHSQPFTTSQLYRWAQTTDYKLYDSVNDSRFVNILTDTLEQFPLMDNSLTTQQQQIKARLQRALDYEHN